MTRSKCPLKLVVVLSDGIRGHTNQSLGVAKWLSDFTGAEIFEAEVPQLKGALRVKSSLKAHRLVTGGRREAREWLAFSEGDVLMRVVGSKFGEKNICEGSRETLIISTGTRAALYNLALGYIWRCNCATVMTPAIVGTDPFDYAIVPEHDSPKRNSNVLVTLGAPNMMRKENLAAEGAKLLAEYPPGKDKIWSVIIGGDSPNYTIDGAWIKKYLSRIIGFAENDGADIYITTSRRTSSEAVKAIKECVAATDSVRHVFIASEDPRNPIPAMLGASQEVFCSNDSISMVSEAITGGGKIVMLEAGKKKGPRKLLSDFTAWLASAGGLQRRHVVGVRKYDVTFDHIIRHGAAHTFADWSRGRRGSEISEWDESEAEKWRDFNEARRAAKWICTHWQ